MGLLKTKNLKNKKSKKHGTPKNKKSKKQKIQKHGTPKKPNRGGLLEKYNLNHKSIKSRKKHFLCLSS